MKLSARYAASVVTTSNRNLQERAPLSNLAPSRLGPGIYVRQHRSRSWYKRCTARCAASPCACRHATRAADARQHFAAVGTVTPTCHRLRPRPEDQCATDYKRHVRRALRICAVRNTRCRGCNIRGRCRCCMRQHHSQLGRNLNQRLSRQRGRAPSLHHADSRLLTTHPLRQLRLRPTSSTSRRAQLLTKFWR